MPKSTVTCMSQRRPAAEVVQEAPADPWKVQVFPGNRGGRGKKIAMVMANICGGGVETVHRDLAENLSKDDWIVDCIAWQCIHPAYERIATSFDEMIILNEPFEKISPIEGPKVYPPIAQCASFQQVLREKNYDAVIMTCVWGPYWVAHMHGIPIIEYWHGFGCWNGWSEMPATEIIVVSDVTRQQIEELRPVHAPVTVVNNAVDFDRYKDVKQQRAWARERLSLPADAPVLLYCGRFSYEKRPQDAMEAFIKAKQLQPDLVLLMAGTCQGLDYWMKLGRQYGCRWGEDTWQYTLSHDEVEWAYAAADVMVHPSEWEGLGMVLLEAMAVGVPIVSTQKGGCEQLLKGIASKVELGDTDAMAREIYAILNNPKQAHIMIQKGRDRVSTQYTTKDQAAKVDAVLRRVLINN